MREAVRRGQTRRAVRRAVTSLTVGTGQMIGLNERGMAVGEVVAMMRDAETLAVAVPRVTVTVAGVGLTGSRAAVALMTQLTGCSLTPPYNPRSNF